MEGYSAYTVVPGAGSCCCSAKVVGGARVILYDWYCATRALASQLSRELDVHQTMITSAFVAMMRDRLRAQMRAAVLLLASVTPTATKLR